MSDKYIIETTSNELTYNLLYEAIATRIPTQVKEQLRKPTVRKKMLEQCGEKAFLLPKEMKFPIVQPGAKDCSPDCTLLHAAYVRAMQWRHKFPKYNKVAQDARKMLKDSDCESKLGIKLEESLTTEILDLDTVIEILDAGLQDENQMSIAEAAIQFVSRIG